MTNSNAITSPERLLVASTTGLGDSLWGTPALRALKKSFPAVDIHLLVNPRWKSLFYGNPNVNRLFEYHHQWYRQPRMALRLLPFRYDAALIFHANRDIRRLLAWVRTGPVWGHQNMKWIPDTHRLQLDSPIHGIERRLTLIQRLGAVPDGGRMEIFFSEQERGEAEAFFSTFGLTPKEYVYLNVGASGPHRRWPPERFVELAEKILSTTPFRLVLGGGPAEQSMIDTMIRRLDSGRVVHSCGLSLKADSWVIGQSRLFVTCDTGPMHIGFALETPTVALFGPYHPTGTGPFDLKEGACFPVESPNSGHRSRESMKDTDFLDQISVDAVWEQVKAALNL